MLTEEALLNQKFENCTHYLNRIVIRLQFLVSHLQGKGGMEYLGDLGEDRGVSYRFADNDISVEDLESYQKEIQAKIDDLIVMIEEIQKNILEKKILCIDFKKIDQPLSTLIRPRKSWEERFGEDLYPGVEITVPDITSMKSDGSGVIEHFKYTDRITSQLENLIQYTEKYLGYFFYQLFLRAKQQKIEIIELKKFQYGTYIDYDLREIIQHNTAIRYIKIDGISFSVEFFLDNFVNLIHAAPSLCGLELSCCITDSGTEKIFSDLTHLKKRCFYLHLRSNEQNIFFLKNDTDDLELLKNTEAHIDDRLSEIDKKNFFPWLVMNFNRNAAVTCTLDDGWYPIDYALRFNSFIGIKYLISHGFSFRDENKKTTTLHDAVKNTDPKILEYVLKNGLKKLINYTDEASETPIFVSVKNNSLENVRVLIEDEPNLIQEKCHGKMLIDVAFEKNDLDMALCLLKAGSPFPDNMDKIMDKIQEKHGGLLRFIRTCEDFKDTIKSGDIEKIKKIINDGRVLQNFRSRNNESAPYIAFSSKQYEVYALLRSEGFRIFEHHESLGVSDLPDVDKEKITRAMIKFINKPNLSTVTYLLSRSRILQKNHKYFEFVKQIYEKLTEIPEIQVILETLEYAPLVLDIIFDFESNSIQDICATAGPSTMGCCNYKEGRILIGAKVEQCELLGTVAHELTHQAMEVVFKNDCFPYYRDRVDDSQRVNGVISTLKDLCDIDPIMRRVFTVYGERDWAAEIVVRVPHMLAKYGQDKGGRLLQEQANCLFDFYKNHIHESCKQFILKAKANLSSHDVSPETYIASQIRKQKSFFETAKDLGRRSTPILVTTGAILFLYAVYNKNSKGERVLDFPKKLYSRL